MSDDNQSIQDQNIEPQNSVIPSSPVSDQPFPQSQPQPINDTVASIPSSVYKKYGFPISFKSLSLIILFLLMGSVFVISQLSSQKGSLDLRSRASKKEGSVLKNGSFEQKLLNWKEMKKDRSDKIEIIAQGATQGANAVKLTNTSGKELTLYQDVKVDPDTWYTVRTDGKRLDGDAGASIELREYNLVNGAPQFIQTSLTKRVFGTTMQTKGDIVKTDAVKMVTEKPGKFSQQVYAAEKKPICDNSESSVEINEVACGKALDNTPDACDNSFYTCRWDEKNEMKKWVYTGTVESCLWFASPVCSSNQQDNYTCKIVDDGCGKKANCAEGYRCQDLKDGYGRPNDRNLSCQPDKSCPIFKIPPGDGGGGLSPTIPLKPKCTTDDQCTKENPDTYCQEGVCKNRPANCGTVCYDPNDPKYQNKTPDELEATINGVCSGQAPVCAPADSSGIRHCWGDGCGGGGGGGQKPAEKYIRIQLTMEKKGSAIFDNIRFVEGQDNAGPKITSTAPNVATVGAQLNYQVIATDENKDTITFGLGALPCPFNNKNCKKEKIVIPKNAAISPSGLFTFTPEASGSAKIQLWVSDGMKPVKQEFRLTIN